MDEPVIEHEHDDETPASIAIIQAICALEDVDPMAVTSDLGIRLYDHVDPEALDRIVAAGSGREGDDGGETVVSFELSNSKTYRVDVFDTGRLRVAPKDSHEHQDRS
ncbi:HalOD1 output domain-containing protein [Natrialbaceae archaeon GCM10025810]|uniref:HalOD1 output domain-containing protein n=1 Tax=Halovalidus salilacus TaxID=3075124 RepID=UPI00360C2071